MMLEPMLCKKVKTLPCGNYIYEEKYDGGRVIAIVKEGKAKLYTRDKNDITSQFPEITEAFKQYKGNYIFDGEICVIRAGKCDFKAYQKRVLLQNPFQIQLKSKLFPASYFIFDILEYNGEDLRFNALIERKKILANVIHNNIDSIKHVIWYKNPDILLKKQNSIEGIVAKDMNSIYEEGKRSNAWLKYRFMKEEIVEIVNFENTPSGIVAISEDGNRITINGRQAEAVRQAIIENGKVKLEINYYEKSNGKFRFPSFKRIVGDKDGLDS